jgi:hypothetical protein
MNVLYVSVWRKTVMGYSKALSQNSLGETKENHKNLSEDNQQPNRYSN